MGYQRPRPLETKQMVFDSRRHVEPPLASGGPAAGSVDALGALYPTLLQFLTLEVYGDGTRRVPGSVTLFFDAGVLKACLNDKDASVSAFVSGAGLAGLLESMEAGLVGDRLDWRAARVKGRKR